MKTLHSMGWIICGKWLCAEKGGASGIRACWADNVREIRKVTKLPIIGINKVIHDGFNPVLDVCITPSFEAAAEIIEAGADIIASWMGHPEEKLTM